MDSSTMRRVVRLVLMETLADFGVTSYFGIQTFTTGILKAWLSMDNRAAAAQLSTMLLALVMGLLWLEHRAQRRMRFSAAGPGHAAATEALPVPLRGVRCGLAWLVCAVPVLTGTFMWRRMDTWPCGQPLFNGLAAA